MTDRQIARFLNGLGILILGGSLVVLEVMWPPLIPVAVVVFVLAWAIGRVTERWLGPWA